LVPVLKAHGYDFLSNRFQQRLLKKEASLHITSVWIQQQLFPQTSLELTLNELVEAEIVSIRSPPSSESSSTTASANDFLVFLQAQSSPLSTSSLTAESNFSFSLHIDDIAKGIVAVSFVSLLQLPFRLDSPSATPFIPEMLVFDTKRLASVRDIIDKIVLENSLLMMIKQTAASQHKIMLNENEEMEFLYRIDVILSQLDFTIDHVIDECYRFLLSIIMIRKRHITNPHQMMMKPSSSSSSSLLSSTFQQNRGSKTNLSSTPEGGSGSPRYSDLLSETIQENDDSNESDAISKELRNSLEKSTKDIIKEGNPVLQLFTKRIYKLLIRVLLDKPYQQKLKQFSLQSKGHEKNFHSLFSSLKALFHHNYKVFGSLYSMIIKAILLDSTNM
jgi:hypothetical protein